jgi:hypothetical protein
MHQALDVWRLLFRWLSDNSAAHSTTLLVFITAWYAVLTYRMSKAMNRQTRAMVQPVLDIEVRGNEDEFYPKGSFIIRNAGTQPLILLDIELYCHMADIGSTTHQYSLWDEHILPPGQELQPLFDFTREFERQGAQIWTRGWYSYQLRVVASDLSKSIVLTYSNIPVLSVTNVKAGLPRRVRWRHWNRAVRWRYLSLRNSINRNKAKWGEKTATSPESGVASTPAQKHPAPRVKRRTRGARTSDSSKK